MVKSPNTYPGVSGAEARRLIAEDKRADERFDNQQDKPLREALGPSPHPVTAAEQRRVTDMLDRQREEAMADYARDLAREVERQGGKVSESEMADGPTPEQFSQAGPEGFRKVAEVGRGDAREGATVFRRMSATVAHRMHRRGQLDDDQLKVCVWYADAYERCGFLGRVSSTDFQREVFTSPTLRSAFTLAQQEAQDELRYVRKKMHGKLKFFEAIVVHNRPLDRVLHLAQRGRPAGLRMFRKMAEAALSAAQEIGALD